MDVSLSPPLRPPVAVLIAAAPADSPLPIEPWYYELVPLHPQPHVDLSVSLRSRFVTNPALRKLLRLLGGSVFTFLGYLVYLVITMAVFIIPARIGRPLAITGALCGLPAALLSISNLRFEMVKVQSRTYDLWFFTATATVFAVTLSLVFYDARCLILVVSWLSFVSNVFIDASVVGQRRFWVANIVSVLCHAVMGATVSVGITDSMHVFDLFRINGHALPAVAVVRDTLASMTVVLLRNLYREYTHRKAASSKIAAADPGTQTVTCVSYRCRLRVQLVAVAPALLPLSTITTAAVVATPSKRDEPGSASISPAPSTTRTQLGFVSGVNTIDAHKTLLPTERLPRLFFPSTLTDGQQHLQWRQWCLLALGSCGFLVCNAAFLITLTAPVLALQRDVFVVAVAGTCGSSIFIGICLAATQRQLLHAVVTSFDFVFIAAQATVVLLAVVDLWRWHRVMVVAAISSWLWSLWIMSWDALLPSARICLGVPTRFVAWIGTGIICLLATCAFLLLVVVPPDAMNDRILFTIGLLGHALEIRLLPWYVSCTATILAWAIRVIWRLWRATDGELFVLDGAVAYEYRRARHRNAPQRVHAAAQHLVGAAGAIERPAAAPHAIFPVDHG